MRQKLSAKLSVQRSNALSCSIQLTVVTIKKNFKRYTIVSRNISYDKSYKVGTAVEFQLLQLLDSIQHSSKAESPNNRSAKQSSVRTLLVSYNQLFFLFCFFFVFLYFYVQNTGITTLLQ